MVAMQPEDLLSNRQRRQNDCRRAAAV